MLEKVVQIVWVEEQLVSIRAEECSIENAFCGIRKIFENHIILALINQS